MAVDAANLVRDHRGMGRVARATLRYARDETDLKVTLLADKAHDVRALRAEFGGVNVRPAATAGRSGIYDAVWYPFNGMRFAAAAPSLVTIHDPFAFTYPHASRIARFREQRPMRRAAERATRIVTDSQWSRSELRGTLGIAEARIDVVAPAPDVFWCLGAGDALPPQLRPGEYALVVGANEPRKNAALALRACALAFAEQPYRLVIVGGLAAPDRKLARSLALRCGEIAASDEMLRALYRNARVVLVPSLAEGFGLVAAEALACGAAVIASNATALPEATGGAALLLDPHDRASWAAAIRDVFANEARVLELRARARALFAGADRCAPARATSALLRALASGAAR